MSDETLVPLDPVGQMTIEDIGSFQCDKKQPNLTAEPMKVHRKPTERQRALDAWYDVPSQHENEMAQRMNLAMQQQLAQQTEQQLYYGLYPFLAQLQAQPSIGSMFGSVSGMQMANAPYHGRIGNISELAALFGK